MRRTLLAAAPVAATVAFASPAFATDDEDDDVGVSGNLGWESGTFTITQKGKTIETGKFVSVSRKADGKWLYIRDMWSTDSPPPPAPAAAMPAR